MKIPTTPLQPDNVMTASSQVSVLLGHSDSPVADPYESPEFQLDWDNQVKFHVSRHLMHLRRYRRESQAKLAKAIGTSQPQIARIEGGDENITLDTVERIVRELKGRFRISIAPAEFPAAAPSVWWENELEPTRTVGSWMLTLGVKMSQIPQVLSIAVTSPTGQVLVADAVTSESAD